METPRIIIELIKTAGISQKKFADDLGIPEYMVSDWKRGKTTSYTEYLTQIADYFSVTTDYLLGRTETRTALDGQPLSENQELFLTEINDLTEGELAACLNFVRFEKSKRN
jgi:transcriptional regulator with XRE-family HTH domain